jgi:hypothetical protein
MPVTLLDIIVLTVMLISGLLAMVRGFLREVFSILSWVVAAGVTVYFQKQLLPVVKQYIAQDTAALAVTVAVLFLGTLLVATIITARISDVVLDSRIGALDRTLGFMFGLARGLLLMVIAMLFFNWLVPPPAARSGGAGSAGSTDASRHSTHVSTAHACSREKEGATGCMGGAWGPGLAAVVMGVGREKSCLCLPASDQQPAGPG